MQASKAPARAVRLASIVGAGTTAPGVVVQFVCEPHVVQLIRPGAWCAGPAATRLAGYAPAVSTWHV